jgi:hypothetical protein
LDLYSRLKVYDGQDPCSDGEYIAHSLTMLSNYGAGKYSALPQECRYTNATTSYPDKLYSFENISTSSENIKTALYQNSPVVISVDCYKSDWRDRANWIDGVWNGSYSGDFDGGHAMCIVGYDDNKGGGSFLVMNSWGTDWGNNGFWWLKYSNVGYLNSAHALILDPDKNHDSHNTAVIPDDVSNQYYTFKNECNVTAYVAFVMHKDGDWVNRGWYAVESGSGVDLEIDGRGAENVYWTAISPAYNLVWEDIENGLSLCVDPVNAYTYYDKVNHSCGKTYKFHKSNPGWSGDYTMTLTCGNIGRGDEVVLQPGKLELKADTGDVLVANLNWKKGYYLHDAFTGKMIQPVIDKESLAYTIWYIDKKNIIQTKTLSEDQLEKMKVYKFISKQNTERWLNSKK